MARADDLRELALLARDSGDVDLEIIALEQLQGLQQQPQQTGVADLLQKPIDVPQLDIPQINIPAQDQTRGQRRGSQRRSREGAAVRREETETRDQALFEQFEAGEITSADLNPDEITAIQRKRVENIPELAGSFQNLSENLSFMDALAGLVTFDPDEVGRILTDSDPNIGVVTTPEGERIAVNNETGAAFSINKLGPSFMDALQLAWFYHHHLKP